MVRVDVWVEVEYELLLLGMFSLGTIKQPSGRIPIHHTQPSDIIIRSGEYWMPSVEWFAGALAVAADQGCNATTYWQYADTTYTGQPGYLGGNFSDLATS